MVKAIIVDDEAHCGEALKLLLKNHCAGIEVMAVCNTSYEALGAIQEYLPQLLFLDIEMPEMSGFQLLDKLRPINFELILVSEHDQNAINAIHYGALDYLLKPVNPADLQKAVEKTMQQLETKLAGPANGMLPGMNNNIKTIKKVALPTVDGLQMVPLASIIYCTSASNYTNFILKQNHKLNICRTLKEVESILDGDPFIRVHNTCIVNLNEVKKYIKGEGGILVMSDNTNINVSRSRKEMLLKKLQPGKY